MIQFENVHLSFDTEVIFKKLSFYIETGKHACIAGPSGSGKSSALKIIQGYLVPGQGKVLVKGLNPLLATMSVIGLISLPGMMTGQILGGASPVIAIKYQVMIMLAIVVGCTLTLVLSILLSKNKLFDDFGNVKSLG